MKKMTKLAIVGAIVLVIGATSVTALAASGAGPWNGTAGAVNRPTIAGRAVDGDSDELDALQAQCFDRMKDILDARVAAGTLTQAEEDAFLNALKERQEACDGTGYGYGYGMMGGAGCGRGYDITDGQCGYGCGFYGE